MPQNVPNQIYQYSLLSALMAGVSDTDLSAAELSCFSQGLGTFVRMDGEMVLLDGKVYQLKSDGSVHQAGPYDKVPFVMATTLSPTAKFKTKLESKNSLHAKLSATFPGCQNLFIAYRAEKTKPSWRRLKVRTVGGQEYPGQPLSELGDTQKVFEFNDVKGTVIGFRSPLNWQGISVAGEHMHFISEDRKFGGHVLELEAEEVKIEAAVVSNIHVELSKTKEFNDAKLEINDAGIKKVEG
jgi:alpha-acetolactate decarboxylase